MGLFGEESKGYGEETGSDNPDSSAESNSRSRGGKSSRKVRVSDESQATADQEVKRTGSWKPKTRRIRHVWPSDHTITNAPSGTQYPFNGAGVELEVLEEDVEYVLGLNPNYEAGCCGGAGKRRRVYFELV